jgi:hypothetical protein
MDSLKYRYGLPCLTFLSPVGGHSRNGLRDDSGVDFHRMCGLWPSFTPTDTPSCTPMVANIPYPGPWCAGNPLDSSSGAITSAGGRGCSEPGVITCPGGRGGSGSSPGDAWRSGSRVASGEERPCWDETEKLLDKRAGITSSNHGWGWLDKIEIAHYFKRVQLDSCKWSYFLEDQIEKKDNLQFPRSI